jgi:hypothetical protein
MRIDYKFEIRAIRILNINTTSVTHFIVVPIYLISQSTFLLEKLIVAQQLNFEHFIEPECSLPCSQEPTTGPCPEPY